MRTTPTIPQNPHFRSTSFPQLSNLSHRPPGRLPIELSSEAPDGDYVALRTPNGQRILPIAASESKFIARLERMGYTRV